MDTSRAFEVKKTVRTRHIKCWGLARYHNEDITMVCVFTDFEAAQDALDAHIKMSHEEKTSETFFIKELDLFPGTL